MFHEVVLSLKHKLEVLYLEAKFLGALFLYVMCLTSACVDVHLHMSV